MNTEPRQVRMTLSTVEGQCSRLLPVATDGLRVATANKAIAIIVGFNFWEVCRNLSRDYQHHSTSMHSTPYSRHVNIH